MTNPFLDPDYPLDISGGTVIRGRDVTLQERPEPPQPPPRPVTSAGEFTIEQMLNGTPFYDNTKDGDKWVGLPIALENALEHATPEGIVLTMPELITAKVKADTSHQYWKKWYSVHTEENIGPNYDRKIYSESSHLLVLVNGGGILTPDRIKQAYQEGLIENSAKYEESEFRNLLQGRLPTGENIPMFSFDDIKQGTPDLPHRFGVVMPYGLAQGTSSDYHNRQGFLDNPLVIARNAGTQNLAEYFDKAKSSNKVGCWHPFSGRDASVPQGRLVFLDYNSDGLLGYGYLINSGRFVGVAPEARSARR